MPLQAQILSSTSNCTIGYQPSLVAALWKLETRPTDVQKIISAVELAKKISSGPLGLVQVVMPSAVIPEAQAREALGQMLRRLNGIVSHSALIYIGDGFRAAVCRSIVTGLTALSNPGYPHKVFPSVSKAAEWMAEGHDMIAAAAFASLVATVSSDVGRAPGEPAFGSVRRGDDSSARKRSAEKWRDSHAPRP